MPLTPADFDAIPRLGWVREATPVTSLPATAESLGLSYLGVKRDDLLEPLHGGTKPRKLDYVLAAPPFADAPAWASSGGIGSGSLVALTAAAQKLDRRLRAHMFWTPCERIAGEGVHLEPVYTGKAMAAVIGDARRLGLRNVLFWCTVRRSLPEPDPAWRERLPPALRRRLDDPASARVTRRRVLVGLAAAAAVGVAIRTTGYADLPGFPGEVLSTWHAHVIMAAAEALLPPDTDPAQIAAIPARLDRYLVGMPPKVKREAKAMLALIEHGTTPLGGEIHRLTRIAPAERERYLAGLEAKGGVRSQAYRALRDLVMLGYYQQPSTWRRIHYEGPRVPLSYDPRGPVTMGGDPPAQPVRVPWPAYDALVAKAGALPKGVLR